MTAEVRITRRATFAAGHILCREDWSDAKNRPGGGYRRRDRFDNQEGWLAYIVGVT